MKILVQANPAAGFDEWHGLALLALDQKEIDALWRYEEERRELQLRHAAMDAIVLWNCACTFAEVEAEEILDARLLALFDQNSHVIVPDDFVFPEEEKITRTDCDRVHITVDSVYWSAGMKHGDAILETGTLGWNMFTCWIHGTQEIDKTWCLRCATL